MPLNIIQTGNIIEINDFVEGLDTPTPVDSILLVDQIENLENNPKRWVVSGGPFSVETEQEQPEDEDLIPNFNFNLQFFYDPHLMDPQEISDLVGSEDFTENTYIGLVQVMRYSINGEEQHYVRSDFPTQKMQFNLPDMIEEESDNLSNEEVLQNYNFDTFGYYVNTTSYTTTYENKRLPFYSYCQAMHRCISPQTQCLYPQIYGGLVRFDPNPDYPDTVYNCATIDQTLTLHPKYAGPDSEKIIRDALRFVIRDPEAFEMESIKIPIDFAEISTRPSYETTALDLTTLTKNRHDWLMTPPITSIHVKGSLLYYNLYILKDYCILSWEVTFDESNLLRVTTTQRPANDFDEQRRKEVKSAIKEGDDLPDEDTDEYDYDLSQCITVDYIIFKFDDDYYMAPVNDIIESFIQNSYTTPSTALLPFDSNSVSELPELLEYQYSIITYPVAFCTDTQAMYVIHDGIYVEITKIYQTDENKFYPIRIISEPCGDSCYEQFVKDINEFYNYDNEYLN